MLTITAIQNLKMIKKILPLLTLLTISFSAFAEPQPLSLKGTDDQLHQLSEYVGKGKWVVVNVWSSACKFCRFELPDLVDFHDTHYKKDAMVLGIAIDLKTFGYPDEQTVKNFVQDYFIDYPNLYASADQAAEMVSEPITAIPISFFFNPQGEMVGHWQGIIERDQLEKIIQSNSADNSKPDMNDDQLGSGEKSRRQPHKS